MADNTKIEWTDATWQPITGCAVVSPGCTNCYAMRLAGTRLAHLPSRAGLTRDSRSGPVWTGETRLNEDWLTQPLRWRRPRRIFVCAHGDLFAESVPDAWIDRVFAVMALAPQHTFQVLTKRAKRMRKWASAPDRLSRIAARAFFMEGEFQPQWPLPNVWLGVSVEDQARADERIPDLLATPAAVRFVSAEPLLSSLDLSEWLDDRGREGLSGAGSLGLVHGSSGRNDLEERDLSWRRRLSSDVDRTDAGGAERFENRRLPQSDVQRSGEAAPSVCAQGLLDDRKSSGHPAVDGDQSRAFGRRQTAERSEQPDLGHSEGKRGSCDPRAEAKAEGAARREECHGQSDRAAGCGNPGVGGIPLSASTRDRQAVRSDTERSVGDRDREKLAALDWIIVGGESGPGARPMHPDWARDIRDQCAAAGVAFFFKQNGEWQHMPERAHFKEQFREEWRLVESGIPGVRPALMFRVGKKRAGRLLDGYTHDDMPGSRATL